MALANKYRPKSFSEVIGQDNAVLACLLYTSDAADD